MRIPPKNKRMSGAYESAVGAMVASIRGLYSGMPVMDFGGHPGSAANALNMLWPNKPIISLSEVHAEDAYVGAYYKLVDRYFAST